MNNDVKTTRVNLDGVHSLDISVNEKAKTVVTELMSAKNQLSSMRKNSMRRAIICERLSKKASFI